ELFDQHRANLVAKAIRAVQQLTEPKPYSRAEHALIECLIHYTRVAVFANTSRHHEAVALSEKIREYVRLVKRVSRKPAHLLICDELLEAIDRLVGRR
ncbi:MAG: DUF447 family protein, partial [Candidatus Caldarchaeum sp.]|nr:DUF447 family protein [Candidatus Caldarchaeum sp.]